MASGINLPVFRRAHGVRNIYILYTISAEPRYPLYRARFSRWNYLLLQRTECRALPSVNRFKEERTDSQGSA
jgi:hypothetical protein